MICYTSSGVNLFVHVCEGKISNFSFSETEAGCGMENKICEFSKTNHKTAFKTVNDCCKNHSVKADLKTQKSENTENLNFFLNGQKNSAIILESFNRLFGYQFNEFEDISPHYGLIKSVVKKGIYLLFQNFRN